MTSLLHALYCIRDIWKYSFLSYKLSHHTSDELLAKNRSQTCLYLKELNQIVQHLNHGPERWESISENMLLKFIRTVVQLRSRGSCCHFALSYTAWHPLWVLFFISFSFHGLILTFLLMHFSKSSRYSSVYSLHTIMIDLYRTNERSIIYPKFFMYCVGDRTSSWRNSINKSLFCARTIKKAERYKMCLWRAQNLAGK